MMIRKMLALPLLILLGSFVMAGDTPQTLFDFTGADAAKEWQNVNDGVMGGISEGKFKITEKKTLEFFGKLSLDNNGGFASVRTKAKIVSEPLDAARSTVGSYFVPCSSTCWVAASSACFVACA